MNKNFFQNFFTAILWNNIKSKKTCPGFSFVLLDLEIIFVYVRVCVFCDMRKNSHTLFD